MNEPKCYISDIELICIRKQGDLMDINRSTIYYNAIPENEENHRIMRLMDEFNLLIKQVSFEGLFNPSA